MRAARVAGIADEVDYQKQDGIPMNTGRQYVGTNDLRFMGKLDARYAAK